jgi:transposase
MTNFRTIDRQTGFLLPPSVDEWLPEKHLARFVGEVIDGLDLRAMSGSYRGSGSASYHPRMLLGILVYGYATGVFSSRKLERATYDSVAFRFIAANDHPDHDTIAAFRRRFLKEIEALFIQVLLLAREMGVLKMGTIGLDGTKIHANASRHSALSYEHAGKIEAQLKAEVADLMAKAEEADAADVPDGMSIPDELARREERLRKIAEARAKIEAPRNAIRASRRSMKPNLRRARPRPRQRARSPAASRHSRRPRDRGRAIRSISPTKTHASCPWREAASSNATMRKPPWPRGAYWWSRSMWFWPPTISSNSSRCWARSAPCRKNWVNPKRCWRTRVISARRMSRHAKRRGSNR